MLFLTCITLLYFLLSNTKDDILKNVGNQAVLVNIDYHYMDKKKHLFFFFKVCSFMFHRRKSYRYGTA